MRSVAGLLLVALLTACGDGGAKARADAGAAARAVLAENPSQALHLVKEAKAQHGSDPRLALVEAEALTALDRRDDAIEAAEEGLAVENLPDDLRADLSWWRGAALMKRYLELSSENDRRSANKSLETAAAAGAYRVKAATALVFLQDPDKPSNQDRILRFARLVLELAPGSNEATQVQAFLDAHGLKP
jgi:hypothetical protein